MAQEKCLNVKYSPQTYCLAFFQLMTDLLCCECFLASFYVLRFMKMSVRGEKIQGYRRKYP